MNNATRNDLRKLNERLAQVHADLNGASESWEVSVDETDRIRQPKHLIHTYVQPAIDVLLEVKDDVAELACDERDKFDNLSEGLQESENGQRMSEAADYLEQAESELDTAIDCLNEMLSDLKKPEPKIDDVFVDMNAIVSSIEEAISANDSAIDV